MRRFLGALGLLFVAYAASAAPKAEPVLGGSLEDALAEIRADTGSEFKLFHYHFDVASPGSPVRADPDGGKSGRLGFTLPAIERTASIAWDERPAGWRKVSLHAKSVSIDFGLKQTVFVSATLPEADCRYRSSWEHELRHAARFSALFVRALEPMKKAVEDEAAALGLPTPAAPAVLKEGEASRLREAAAERLSAAVERHAAALLERMEADRYALDQPDAYARAVPRCGAPLAAASAPAPHDGAKPGLLVP